MLAYSTYHSNRSDEDKIVDKNQNSFGKLTSLRFNAKARAAKSKVQILSIDVENLDVIVSCRLDNGRGKNIDFKFDSYNDKVVTITDKLITVGLIAEDQCDDVESLLSDIVVSIGSTSKADLQQLVGWTVPSKPSTPTTPTTTPQTTTTMSTTTRAIFQIGGEDLPSASTKSLNDAANEGSVGGDGDSAGAFESRRLSGSPKRVVSLDTGMSLDLESLERRLKRVLKRTPSGRIAQSSTEVLAPAALSPPSFTSKIHDVDHRVGAGVGVGDCGRVEGGCGGDAGSGVGKDADDDDGGNGGGGDGGGLQHFGSSHSSLTSDYWDFGDLPSFITKVSSNKKAGGGSGKSVKFSSCTSSGAGRGKMRVLQRHVSDVSHNRPRVRLVQRSASFQKGRFQVFPVDEVEAGKEEADEEEEEEGEEEEEKKEKEEEEEEKDEEETDDDRRRDKDEAATQKLRGDGQEESGNSRSSYDDEADDDDDDDDEDDDDIDIGRVMERQKRELEALRKKHEAEVGRLQKKRREKQQRQQQHRQQQQQQQKQPKSADNASEGNKKKKSVKKNKMFLAKSLSTPSPSESASRRRRPTHLQIAGTEQQQKKQQQQQRQARRLSAGSAPSSPDRLTAPHLHPAWMQQSADADATPTDGLVEGASASSSSGKGFQDLAASFKTGGSELTKKRASADQHQLQQQLRRSSLTKGRRCSNVLTDMMRAFTTGTRGKM